MSESERIRPSRSIVRRCSRNALVLVTVLIALILISFLLYLGGLIFHIETHLTEISVAIISPILVIACLAWFLFGFIKEVETREAEAIYLATYDQLTKALTRRGFFDKANDLIKLAKRDSQILSVLMIDIDFFKTINDNYGHATGDLVLENIGQLISSRKRETDLFGRVGGEEFAFVLWGMDETAANKYAENLHHAIHNTIVQFNGELIPYTVSIGISCFEEDNSDISLDELLKKADDALYFAKKHGRNKTVSYTQIT